MSNKHGQAPNLVPKHHANLDAIEAYERELITKLWEPVEGTAKEAVDQLHIILKDIEKVQVVKNNLIQVAYMLAQKEADALAQSGLILLNFPGRRSVN